MNKKMILSALGVVILSASAYAAAGQVQTTDNDVVAREASEAPRGQDNNNQRRHRGGRVSEDAGEMILARRGADDPPGTEAPGDNHRQRRGGRGGRA